MKLLEGEIVILPKHQRKLDELGLAPGYRLACMSTADDNLVLEVGQYEAIIQADNTLFSFESRPGCGVAIDLGTTTLVAQLLDLSTGKVQAVETALNPQRKWGSDLISRLESALAGNETELTHLIREAIGSMLLKLIRGRELTLDRVVLVGNTVMQHFFAGSDIKPLSFYPFESSKLGAKQFTASELGWEIDCAAITFFPSIGSFVGSDILAGIHATGMMKHKEYSILVDLGTNGEIVVGNSQHLLCASTAEKGRSWHAVLLEMFLPPESVAAD